MKALSRFTMLDLTHMLSGPYATMLLTDLGMRTIKIEPPGTGEGTRRLLAGSPAHARDGVGAYFLTLNRGKESVAINLKSEAGRDLFYRMVEKADVVVDNFAAGVTERLGIGPARLAEVNPRIVTCSVTGFGADGPGARRPAFDLVAQAMGGGMSLTGEPGGRPMRSGIPIGDLGGGLFAVVGILSALHDRDLSGCGQHVDISMLDAQVSMLNYMATMFTMSGIPPQAEGNGHFVHVPYNTFPTATRHIVIAVIADNRWPGLLRALEAPHLDREEFLGQPGRLAAKAEIEAEIAAILARKPVEHWLERLEDAGVPCAPVNGIPDAVADPQILHRNMMVEIAMHEGRPLTAPGNPVKLSANDDPTTRPPPPRLGAQTDAVLSELLDIGPEELAALRLAGVVG
ncbi:MAG: CoA transferase [Rhodobacteraceae bacterium]|nr:CoA transferase [Paracoccaceae bacterium]